MRAALVRGARRAAVCSPLVVVLWFVNGLFGAFAALASGTWLFVALDGSLATRTLLKDLDPEVFVDLYARHGAGFRMLLVVLAVLAVAYLLLWFCLQAAIILAVREGTRAALREVWTRGVETAPRMATLFVIAALAMLAWSGAVGGAVWGLLEASRTSPAAMVWAYIVGSGFFLWGAGAVFLVAVHDHARIRACATAGGASSTYRWAFRFVLRGGERAFALALVLQACGFLIWMGYQWVGLSVPVNELIGVTGSLLWGQAFMLARMWVRVWIFAAQGEIQP
jgi:hypothetical protein